METAKKIYHIDRYKGKYKADIEDGIKAYFFHRMEFDDPVENLNADVDSYGYYISNYKVINFFDLYLSGKHRGLYIFLVCYCGLKPENEIVIDGLSWDIRMIKGTINYLRNVNNSIFLRDFSLARMFYGDQMLDGNEWLIEDVNHLDVYLSGVRKKQYEFIFKIASI